MVLKIAPLLAWIISLMFTLSPLNSYSKDSESLVISGLFRCGNGIIDNERLLNCSNAYIHALNFEGNPHIHATANVQTSGQFQIEVPFVKTENSTNEMTFILRSLDEDRVLGIFYRIDNEVDGGLTESFFVNRSRDFGLLKISKKREIIINDLK